MCSRAQKNGCFFVRGCTQITKQKEKQKKLFVFVCDKDRKKWSCTRIFQFSVVLALFPFTIRSGLITHEDKNILFFRPVYNSSFSPPYRGVYTILFDTKCYNRVFAKAEFTNPIPQKKGHEFHNIFKFCGTTPQIIPPTFFSTGQVFCGKSIPLSQVHFQFGFYK